jgi:hypothetical protein
MGNMINSIKHISRGIWGILICVTLSLHFAPISAQSEIIVHQPVSGSFIRDREIGQPATQLGVIDTFEASWASFEIPYSTRSRPQWSPDGVSIAYARVRQEMPSASAIHNIEFNLDTFSTDSLINVLTTSNFTQIMGWGNTSETILVGYVQIIDAFTSNFVLYNVNTVTNMTQEIRSWSTTTSIETMNLPLPPDVVTINLEENFYIQRNPVFDDWMFMHFSGSGYYSNMTSSDEPRRADINVLWNFRTNEYISIDALTPDLWFDARFMDWSHDGTRLILQAFSQDRRNFHIVSFHFTPEGGLTFIDRAVVEERIPQHWLDAGSLFFSIIQSYDGGAAYVLGEIVDGEYREVPFFTLNGEQFSRESFGDWFMRADEAERAELSCIFEWSLPTQLGIGDSPEVVSSSGLTLRERPDRFSPALRSLPQGTVVTIIGGEACSDGYRWWPVRLPDGTEGFVAEADTSEYFLVP